MVFGMGGSRDTVHVDIEGDSSSLQEAAGGAEQSLSSLKKIAGGTGLLFSGAVAAGFVESVSAAADFEEQMAEVGKVMDPEVANRMGDAIKDMATRMPIAHEELATIAATAGRLGVSEEHLESFTESVGKMAIATDLTADEAADAFARIGTLFDFPMDKAEELGSAINTMANNFATDAGEITDVMTRVGGSFAALGIGTGEALGLAAAMNEVSPSSRLAAGDLKRMADAMMDPKNVELFAQALGMTEAEFIALREENPEEAMLQLSEAFHANQETADAMKAQLGAAADGFRTMGLNTDSAREAMEQANHELEVGESLQKEFEVASATLNGQIQLLRNNLANVAIVIGSVLLPYVSQLVTAVSEVLVWFGEWVQAGNELYAIAAGVGAMVGGLALAAATLGPAALAAVGGLSGLATILVAITGPIAIAIGLAVALAYAWQNNLFNIQQHAATAFGIIRTVITTAVTTIRSVTMQALAAIQTFWATHGDTIIATVSGFVSAVVARISAALTMIREWWATHGTTVLAIVDWLFATIRTTIDTVLGIVGTVIETALGAIEEQWALHGENIETGVNEMLTAIREFFAVFFPIVKELVSTALEAIRVFWEEHGAQIQEIAQMAFDAIEVIVGTGMDLILTAVEVGLALVTGAFEVATALLQGDWQGAWDALYDTANTVGGKIWGLVERFVDRVVTFFSDLYDKLVGGSIWPDMWNDMLDDATDIGGKIGDAVSKAIDAVMNFVKNGMEVVRDQFGDKMNAAKEKVTQGFETIKTKATNGMRNFKTKVSNGMKNVRDTVRDGMTAAKTKVTEKFSEFKSAGGTLMTRLKGGISGKKGTVRKAAGSVMNGALNRMRNAYSTAKNIGSTTGTRLGSGLRGARKTARSAAANVINGVLGIFRQSYSIARSIGKTLGNNLANGLSQSKKKLKNAGSKAAGWVRNAFGKSDAEYGPLSDQTDIGPQIARDIAQGLAATRRPVEAAAANVAEGVRSELAAEVMAIELDVAAQVNARTATAGVRGRVGNLATAVDADGATRGRGNAPISVYVDSIHASGAEEGRAAYDAFAAAIRSEGLDGKHR